VIEYVILGTSHPDMQDSTKFGRPVMETIQNHSINLVAEEHNCDSISMACVTTKHLHIPYLQIDLFPQEWAEHGIDREMKLREQLPKDQDIRLSRADGVREDFWLEKIEASLNYGRVLVVCGYLHVDFLALRVERRGGTVLEKNTFPTELLDRKPEKILNLADLEKLIRNGHNIAP
jgi:hypothetical protein